MARCCHAGKAKPQQDTFEMGILGDLKPRALEGERSSQPFLASNGTSKF